MWGLFGGLGAELAVIFAIRHRLAFEHPYWFRSVEYWLIAGAMSLAGALIAVAYSRSGTALNPILAIQVGASAPLILRKLREAVPEEQRPPDPTKID
jgi:hypothetical protein